jgi:hypothetical protein
LRIAGKLDFIFSLALGVGTVPVAVAKYAQAVAKLRRKPMADYEVCAILKRGMIG